MKIFSKTLREVEMIKSLLKNVGIDSFLKNVTLNSYAFEPIGAKAVEVIISNTDSETIDYIIRDYKRNMTKNG